MRYMMLVRSVAPPGPPPSAFLEAMGKLSAEGRESGMLIAGGQLSGADASAGGPPAMRDRSDVTLLGARNSGRCNIDFQSVTGRQNPARALMPTG